MHACGTAHSLMEIRSFIECMYMRNVIKDAPCCKAHPQFKVANACRSQARLAHEPCHTAPHQAPNRVTIQL